VTNIKAAQRIVENQPAPHHDIRFMVGFSLKNLLPPHPTSAVKATISNDNPPRKRKTVERGSSSQPKSRAETPTPSCPSPLSGVSPPSQPRMTLLGNVLDLTAAQRDFDVPRAETHPIWALTFDVFGETLRSNAAILPVGDSMGAKVASSLCQEARLPVDMAEWKGSNDQEVIDNLRRGLMMVRDFPLGFSISVFVKSSYSFFCHVHKGFKANRYFVAKKAADDANKWARAEYQKRQEVEESLESALDSNSATEEKLKTLEVRLTETEEYAFARGRKEVELDITRQLIGIYNKSFQEG
jgi:hypothetical protein